MRPGWPFWGIYHSISDGKHLKLLKSATEVHVQNYNLTFFDDNYRCYQINFRVDYLFSSLCGCFISVLIEKETPHCFFI